MVWENLTPYEWQWVWRFTPNEFKTHSVDRTQFGFPDWKIPQILAPYYWQEVAQIEKKKVESVSDVLLTSKSATSLLMHDFSRLNWVERLDLAVKKHPLFLEVWKAPDLRFEDMKKDILAYVAISKLQWFIRPNIDIGTMASLSVEWTAFSFLDPERVIHASIWSLIQGKWNPVALPKSWDLRNFSANLVIKT